MFTTIKHQMMYQKIYCEYQYLDPPMIAKILFNISINKRGFVRVNDNATIFFDNSCTNLLHYDILHQQSGYLVCVITYSTEWLFIQKFMNSLNEMIKYIMIDILNLCSFKLLSIIDAVLSFPVNDDIKFVIMSNIFTNLRGPVKFYAPINNKWIPFCVEFGGTCNYLTKITAKESVIKKLMNRFITTRMDRHSNIMCTSESFTAFILFNDHIRADFTMLTFDHDSDKISMCLFDKSLNKCQRTYTIFGSPFDQRKLHYCTTIFCSDNNVYKLTKSCTELLIDRVIESLSKKEEMYALKQDSSTNQMHTWYLGNNDLFY